MILQPLKEATKLLEGRGKSGRNRAIWEVLPTLKWLLKLFKEMKDRIREAPVKDHEYQEALEDHYQTNVNSGWLKLQKYYKLLNKTPVYYTAVILHPHLKNYYKNAWVEHPK